MARKLPPRFHIGLNYQTLTDDERHQLISEIKTIAPQSTLYAKVPAIPTSIAALIAKGAVLKTCNDNVGTDRKKLSADLGTETNARGDVDNEVHTLQSLVENNAADEADIANMAFKNRVPKPKKALPTTPESVDIKPPKRARGYTDVSVHETGKLRAHYDAEWSPNPITPTSWATLIGKGKTRRVSGASGTQVWVRFAMVRGQNRSEWCTPVLVTIP